MGNNFDGQLGNGTTSGLPTTPVSVASNVVAVAAGYNHSLFVKTDGTLWAMGWNEYGQLGNGTTVDSHYNLPISVASNVVAVAAGFEHSLFVKTDGTLWAMGYNAYGQLGNGTQPSVLPKPRTNQCGEQCGSGGGGRISFVVRDGGRDAVGDGR